jgi:hypothetical protein
LLVKVNATVVKSVDTRDLKSLAARRASSILASRTRINKHMKQLYTTARISSQHSW